MHKELIRGLRDEFLHKNGGPQAELCRLRAANAIETLVDQMNELLGSYMHLDKTSAEEIADLQAELAAKDRQIERMQSELAAAIADISCGNMCAVCKNRIRGKEWIFCPDAKFTGGTEGAETCANFVWVGERSKIRT